MSIYVPEDPFADRHAYYPPPPQPPGQSEATQAGIPDRNLRAKPESFMSCFPRVIDPSWADMVMVIIGTIILSYGLSVSWGYGMSLLYLLVGRGFTGNHYHIPGRIASTPNGVTSVLFHPLIYLSGIVGGSILGVATFVAVILLGVVLNLFPSLDAPFWFWTGVVYLHSFMVPMWYVYVGILVKIKAGADLSSIIGPGPPGLPTPKQYLKVGVLGMILFFILAVITTIIVYLRHKSRRSAARR